MTPNPSPASAQILKLHSAGSGLFGASRPCTIGMNMRFDNVRDAYAQRPRLFQIHVHVAARVNHRDLSGLVVSHQVGQMRQAFGVNLLQYQGHAKPPYVIESYD